MSSYKKKTLHILSNLVLTIGFIAILFYITFGMILNVRMVKNNDMSPNLKVGDIVIVDKISKSFEVNDVILYTVDNNEYIGRIVATQNDIVDVNDAGYLTINSYPMIGPVLSVLGGINYPCQFVENSYFVVSDNPENALDSRTLGVIESTQIIGKCLTLIRKNNL